MTDNTQDASGGKQSPGERAAARERAVKWAWFQAISKRRQVALKTPVGEPAESGLQTAAINDTARSRPVTTSTGNGLQDAADCDPPELKNQVGIAASGGGLRSAMFFTGLLQAFHHRGLLRYVDYISSVSGGGYASGWMTAQVERARGLNKNPLLDADFDLGADPISQKLTARYGLASVGQYLWSIREVAWRWLFDTLRTTLLVGSCVFSLAFFLALVWRAVDFPASRRVLDAYNFSVVADELFLAFVPTVMIALVWLGVVVTWSIRYVRSSRSIWINSTVFLLIATVLTIAWMQALAAIDTAPHPPGGPTLSRLQWIADAIWYRFGVAVYATLACIAVAYALFGNLKRVSRLVTGLFWLTIVGIAISAAVYLGNGETQVRSGQNTFQLNSFATTLGIIATLIQLLPLFIGSRLLRSEREDASWLQQMTYRILTVGGPAVILFAAVHMAAAENVSGFADYRDPAVIAYDVLDWHEFISIPIGTVVDPSSVMLANSDDGHPLTYRSELRQAVQGSSFHRFRFTGDGSGDMRSIAKQLRESGAKATGDNEGWDRRSSLPLKSIWGSFEELYGFFVPEDNGNHRLSWIAEVADWDSPERGVDVHLLNAAAGERVQHIWAEAFSESVLMRPELTRLLIAIMRKDLRDPSANESKPLPQSYWDLSWTLTPLTSIEQQKLPAWIAQQKQLQVSAWSAWTETSFLRKLSQLLDGGKSIQTSKEIEIATLNRQLLEIVYPEVIRPREMLSTFTLIYRDQWSRLWWFVSCVAVAVVSLRFLDLNRVSPLYHFYRERLHRGFLVCDRKGLPAKSPLLRSVAPHDLGFPIPLLCASRLPIVRLSVDEQRTPKAVVFSPLSCGFQCDVKRSEVPDRGAGHWREEPWAQYAGGRSLTLADAVTISGSAATPLAVPNVMLSIALGALNLRLGRWLPHPDCRHSRRWWSWLWRDLLNWSGIRGERRSAGTDAKLWHIAYDAVCNSEPGWLKYVPARKRKSFAPLFVADGGFDDFLGAMELLRRRCKLIFISDGGSNAGKEEFGSLANLIRLARTELGVVLLDLDCDEPIDVERLKKPCSGESRVCQQFFCCRVRYPNPGREEAPGTLAQDDGVLVYIQMSLTGREDVDLLQIRKHHPQFPDEPISNQRFTPQQVEAYRQLGYHIGKLVCSELPPWRDAACFGVRKLGAEWRPVLEYKELVARVKLAYLWECHRERSHESSEVSVAGLFDVAEASGEMAFSRTKKVLDFGAWSAQVGADAVAIYGEDADLRQAVRELVFQLICRSGSPSANQLGSQLDQIRGTLGEVGDVCVILAVHDLIDADKTDREIRPSLEQAYWDQKPESERSESNASASGGKSGRFKVDGRRILIEAAKLARQNCSDSQAMFVNILAFEVFREHGPATAIAMARLLFPRQKFLFGKRVGGMQKDGLVELREALRLRSLDRLREVFRLSSTPKS